LQFYTSKKFAMVRDNVTSFVPFFMLLLAMRFHSASMETRASAQHQNENWVADDRGNAARAIPDVGLRGEGVLL
jgi:hypothetical protein